MIRAVVDTNILIRAVIRPNGTVGPMIPRLARNEYHIIFSEILWQEFEDKMAQPRLRTRYGVQDRDISRLYDTIVLRGTLVHPTRVITACRDEDDNRVLEAAVTGNAGYIVTSDQDLLVLDPFEGIRILTAREFLAILDS